MSRGACVEIRKPRLFIEAVTEAVPLLRQPIVPMPTGVPSGTVYVIAEECKECGLCISFCPRGVLEFSADSNSKGHHYPVVVKEGQCANCLLCCLICADFAIFSMPVREVQGAESAVTAS